MYTGASIFVYTPELRPELRNVPTTENTLPLVWLQRINKTQLAEYRSFFLVKHGTVQNRVMHGYLQKSNSYPVQESSPCFVQCHTLFRSNHLTDEQLNRNNSLFQMTFVYFGLNLYVYLAAFGDFLNKLQTPLQ